MCCAAAACSCDDQLTFAAARCWLASGQKVCRLHMSLLCASVVGAPSRWPLHALLSVLFNHTCAAVPVELFRTSCCISRSAPLGCVVWEQLLPCVPLTTGVVSSGMSLLGRHLVCQAPDCLLTSAMLLAGEPLRRPTTAAPPPRWEGSAEYIHACCGACRGQPAGRSAPAAAQLAVPLPAQHPRPAHAVRGRQPRATAP